MSQHIFTGSGAPGFTPSAVGHHYIDTVGKVAYISVGTASAADWETSDAGAVAGTLAAHIADTANPHVVTKTQVGLGNVDNTSDANKPVSTATQTALDGKVDENAPITGATKTKITYDAKGLVTAGADATTADVNDSTNRRYVTDAQLTIIGNTSGTNTGDQDLSPYLLITSFVPAGSDTSVQFNDGGVFGGGGAFTFDKATGKMKVPAITYADGTTTLLSDAGVLRDSSGNPSIQISNRGLVNALGDTTLDWNAGTFNGLEGNLALNYSTRKQFNSTDGTNPTIDWELCTLFGVGSGVPSVDWTNRRLENSLGYSLEWDYNGGGVRIYMNGTSMIADFSTQQLIDSSNFKAIEFTTTQRQLFDFGGSYPSVDFGNYCLYNIGITNSVPLLDWSSNAGGSVKIYDGYNMTVIGDFTNGSLNDAAGNATILWSSRHLIDNTYSVSVDWDYHYLSFMGEITVDWQNKQLKHDGGGGPVISVDWKNFIANNSGGFLSVDYGNHTLYDITGLIVTVDYSNRYLKDTLGYTSVDWQLGLLRYDNTSSIDWAGRTLKNSLETILLTWTSGAIVISGSEYTNAGALWTDTTRKALRTYQNGVTQTLQGVIATQTASATVANTVTETALNSTVTGTLSLPPNFFVDGKKIRISASGIHSSTASPTITIRAKLGATTIMTMTGSAGNGSADTWIFEGEITCRTTGASGTVFPQGIYEEIHSNGLRAGSDSAATVTVNTTVSQAVTLTAQWGTANAGNTITCSNLTVEVIN